MVCDIQPDARQRYISRSYGEGESLLVIEGVPVVSCPHCGESYLRHIHCMKLSALNASGKGLRFCFCIENERNTKKTKINEFCRKNSVSLH